MSYYKQNKTNNRYNAAPVKKSEIKPSEDNLSKLRNQLVVCLKSNIQQFKIDDTIPLVANHYQIFMQSSIALIQYDVILSHLNKDNIEKIFENKVIGR